MSSKLKRFAAVLFLCFAAVMVGLPSGARAGLVWHSAMDGNADAIVGTSGAATGTPTATADKNGNANGAVLFGGQSDQDYYTVAPAAASLMAGSISAWVRPDTVDDTEDGVVAVGASGGGSTEYFTVMDRASGDQKWRVDLDDGASRRDVLSNAAPTAGTWQHLVVTFDSNAAGSEQLRMYVDGSLQTDVQAITGDNDPYNPTNNWLIGTERTNERYFNGAIDDVRIYDNELTANEVAALFRDGPLLVGEIPEPATCVLALGLLGLGWYRRRRRAC